MNLKFHLLMRMTLVGLLCWLAVSLYLVADSGRHATQELTTVANQLQPIVAEDVMRRWVSLDSDARRPDLGGAAARFPDPVCLRYRSLDATTSESGCTAQMPTRAVPSWIAPVLTALGPGHISLQRDISAFGIRAGTLRVESDQATLIQHQWSRVRDLLGLTAVLLAALDILAFWVLGRALQPTSEIVAVVEQLGDGNCDVRLPALRPREFTIIARGINQLAKRLGESYAARAELTSRLISTQEIERRELAHELHEEFGQCVAALNALSASFRHRVIAGHALTEADVMPLETGVEGMLTSLRGMLQRMSLPPLDQQGLRSALSDLVAAWQARLRDGPRIKMDADPGIDELLTSEQSLCVYRIVQECLSNIARHAPGSASASIDLRRESNWLRLRVSNDFAATRAAHDLPGTGMGLRLLGERARSLRGVFCIEATALQFAVQSSLPVEEH